MRFALLYVIAPRRLLRVELFVLTEVFVFFRFVELFVFVRVLFGILHKAHTKFECIGVVTSGRTMIVKTLQGIPFLCDPVSKTVYAYEKTPTQPLLALGTYNPETETFTLLENWKELYEPRLKAYRESLKPQSRLPTAAPK